jgi:hypothetical protein
MGKDFSTKMTAMPRHSRPGSRSAWKYICVFLLPVVVATVLLFGSWSFLRNSGELTGPIEAAHLQVDRDELYGSALEFRPYVYKLERYKIAKPDILIVGSSRVLPFAGEAFLSPMVNAGNASSSLGQARSFIDDALAIHKPKAILLGLDFWWFNPAREEADLAAQSDPVIDLTLDRLSSPFKWMLDGTLKPKAVIAGIFSDAQMPPGIGVRAKYNHHGWDRFGRLDYGNLLTGGRKSEDRQFKRTIRRVVKADADAKMYVHIAPSTESLDELAALIKDVRAQGIEIELLLAPLAPDVLDAIGMDDPENLINQLRARVAKLDVSSYDFTDPVPLGSNHCEFVDGFHGGEVTYLRILERIAAGSSIISRAVNQAWVKEMLAANANHASIRALRPEDTKPEIDFLDLGCKK